MHNPLDTERDERGFVPKTGDESTEADQMY